MFHTCCDYNEGEARIDSYILHITYDRFRLSALKNTTKKIKLTPHVTKYIALKNIKERKTEKQKITT